VETESKIVAHIKELEKAGFTADRRTVGSKYVVFISVFRIPAQYAPSAVPYMASLPVGVA
jgi:hypothetical protein